MRIPSKRERRVYLQNRLESLSKDEDVRLFLKWESLSSTAKHDLGVSWKQYYKKVKTTPAYARHMLAREAFKSGNKSELRKILSEEVESVLNKPSSEDPDVLRTKSSVKSFRFLRDEFNDEREKELDGIL